MVLVAEVAAQAAGNQLAGEVFEPLVGPLVMQLASCSAVSTVSATETVPRVARLMAQCRS